MISFNHFLMGPLGMQFLADLGADVIAVEPLEGAFQRKWRGADKDVDGQSMLQLLANRNKRSLALNLKEPDGVAIARRLVGTADIVAENYRPGVMDKLGLGYEQLRRIRPGLIYAAASGFGQDGPYAHRAGQDLIIQAMSGLATITGSREHGPRAVGVSAVDHHGAALFAAGILAALVRRERTGEGGRVDVNLLAASLDLQMESLVCFLNGDRSEDTRPVGHVSTWYHDAPYGVYATLDGFLAISVAPLDAVSEILGIPSEDRIPTAESYRRREEASEQIARAVAQRPTAEWTRIFAERGIWCAPVDDYRRLVVNPQVIHNGNIVTVPGSTGAAISLVSHPVRYDGRAPKVRLPPQQLGAQTADILVELGFDATDVDRLVAAGVVGVPQTETSAG